MKLFDFNKRIESLFIKFGGIKLQIDTHTGKTHLEITFIQDQSTPFDFPEPKYKTFIAIIDLESRYGLKESNFDNVPEEIRTAVFDTIIEFVSTPLDRRF